MKREFRKRLVLFVIAGVMMIVATTGAAYAYFSSYDIRGGSLKLSLSPRTEVEEEPKDTSKTISIKNVAEENGTNVVVRVFVYGPDGMKVTAEDGWVQSGDCWYYKKVLKPGESTSDMVASIEGIDPSVDMSSLDIIVVHEASPAVYDENDKVVAPSGWAGFPEIKAEEEGK